MNNVNYRVLKSNIIKCCKQAKPDGIEFEINIDKLVNMVEDINLFPLPVGLKSKNVKPENIPYLSEYFEKSNLSWFGENREFTVLTFIDTESIDERAEEWIKDLCTKYIDDPDVDKVKAISGLVAYYPCYFATIVSYQNLDPNKQGRPSYVICCRSNKVVIKSSDYQYNPKDFS